MPGRDAASETARDGRQVDGAVRDLSRRLLQEADELGARMAERICAEIPLYAEGEVVSVAQLSASCADNVRFILGDLAGEPQRENRAWITGTERADGGVPYPAVLGAYRVGARYLWEHLVERADPADREVLLLAAADIWSVSDELAAQVTEAYRAALADRTQRDLQRRALVVGSLLDGEAGSQGDLWESAVSLDLDPTGDLVVVAAELVGAALDDVPELGRELTRHNLTSAWRVDRHHLEGLVALRLGFGADQLVDVLGRLDAGRVGVSAAFHNLDEAPTARRQARLACAAGTPGAGEVTRFADRPLAVLLASTPERAEGLLQQVLGLVMELPDEDRAVTLETVHAWFASDGSPSATAERLFVHRNTVRYRLRRLEELTGRDLAKPSDAAEVFMALECARILGAWHPTRTTDGNRP